MISSFLKPSQRTRKQATKQGIASTKKKWENSFTFKTISTIMINACPFQFKSKSAERTVKAIMRYKSCYRVYILHFTHKSKDQSTPSSLVRMSIVWLQLTSFIHSFRWVLISISIITISSRSTLSKYSMIGQLYRIINGTAFMITQVIQFGPGTSCLRATKR